MTYASARRDRRPDRRPRATVLPRQAPYLNRRVTGVCGDAAFLLVDALTPSIAAMPRRMRSSEDGLIDMLRDAAAITEFELFHKLLSLSVQHFGRQ